MKANNITTPQLMRAANLLGKVVANQIRAKSHKDQVCAPNRKKSAASTKPKCITKEGTLFRIVNVISCETCRTYYVATKTSHDKDDQDTRNPKSIEWDHLSSHYRSDEGSLMKLTPGGRNALMGHSVCQNICHEYDELTDEEFQQVVLYIAYWYRSARNKKNQSGNHRSFGVYCDGKTWLLYYHAVLHEIGDTALSNCAYPQLDSSIARTSTDPYIPRGRRGGSSRSGSPSDGRRSGSPVSDGPSDKAYVARATEAAAAAIEDRQLGLCGRESFDRMMSMKRKATKASLKLISLEKAYKSAKKDYKLGRDAVEESTVVSLKLAYKATKRARKVYDLQYETLKKELGHVSPPESSSSSSDDDVDDDDDDNDNDDNE